MREVEVTIEVPFYETHDFIPRLAHWLTSDVEDKSSVNMILTGKGDERTSLFAFSSKKAAIEAGEGYRKQHPSHWYKVTVVGVWDGWEGRMPTHTDTEGKELRLDPVKQINPEE